MPPCAVVDLTPHLHNLWTFCGATKPSGTLVPRHEAAERRAHSLGDEGTTAMASDRPRPSVPAPGHSLLELRTRATGVDAEAEAIHVVEDAADALDLSV